MAEGPRSVWEGLLVELQDRIISFLDANEVAGTFRLVCKAAAARYSGPQHTRIRLSQPVPAHAFAHRWGRPGAMRSLSYAERKQLMCLTAASGSIPNLQLLLPLVGCALDSDVMVAAAAAGQLTMCQWVRQQGCHSHWNNSILEAAGRSGSRALCDWLIAVDCAGGVKAALSGAASAGHVGLVDQLLASYGPPQEPADVIIAAAGGCDLSTLRRLHAAMPMNEDNEDDWYEVSQALNETAAASPTPDWREKMEWLAAQGRFCGDFTGGMAACCPDAVDRLTWLARRGWRASTALVAMKAADRGDVELLRFVLEIVGRQAGPDARTEVRELGDTVVHMAADSGGMALLRHLHSLGCCMRPAGHAAAYHGHLHVLAWLVETLGAKAALDEDVFEAAAGSGSMRLLTWLRERGCVARGAGVVREALRRGASEVVLEWLLEQGCRVELREGEWADPSMRGDLARLAWLRRMGCPWAPDGSTFTQAVGLHSQLPVLRWLAEAGCPVDWDAALRKARADWRGPEALAELEALCARHSGQP